jgi:hypothetical protein
MSQRPKAAGLIVCQHVIVEESTRNMTLVNTFKRLRAIGFPSPPQPFTVYAALTDGRGVLTLDLVVYRPDTLEEIYGRTGRVTFADPLRQERLLVRVSQCSFPVPGRYLISLLADGDEVTYGVVELLSRS